MIARGLVPGNEATQEPSGSGFCELIMAAFECEGFGHQKSTLWRTVLPLEFEVRNYFLGDLNLGLLHLLTCV